MPACTQTVKSGLRTWETGIGMLKNTPVPGYSVRTAQIIKPNPKETLSLTGSNTAK